MTKIYKTYEEFEAREDKSTNGVSPEFAEKFPNFQEDNETNIGCWNCYDCLRCRDCRDCVRCWDCSNCRDCRACSKCRDCSNCVGCVECRVCRDCSDCVGCIYCKGCRDCSNCVECVDCKGCIVCSDCVGCVDCRDCVRCIACSACSDEKHEEGLIRDVPVIENIHQKVYKAASQPGALDMEEWHTCETTHCRAGWVVHLAGEAGYKLERLTSPEQAALLIYGASSPIPVYESDFVETHEEALESMREAAEAEKALNEGKNMREIYLTFVNICAHGGLDKALEYYCQESDDIATGIIGSEFHTSGPGSGWSETFTTEDFAERALSDDHGATYYLVKSDGRMAYLNEEGKMVWTEETVVSVDVNSLEDALDYHREFVEVVEASHKGRIRDEGGRIGKYALQVLELADKLKEVLNEGES